ncbi:MAG: glycosyltransferase [Xenococcaceae cyanobacterium MO_188.B32]|nr:glycosyltransferase [Xenococcaceae cyanobacterium MO_188.B32]
MTHFGILSLAATGHLNTMFPLGSELKRRGHNVTFLTNPEAQIPVHTAGFNFSEVYSPIDRDKIIPRQNTLAILEKIDSLKDIRDTLQKFALIAETRLQKAPKIIKEQGIDALLVDSSVFEGGTIAEYLNLPYITVFCILPFYQDLNIPPIMTTWQYNRVWWNSLRNRMAYGLLNYISSPVWQVISHYRSLWNLPAYSHPNDIFSQLAMITRHISELEFPRQLPPHFHFTGSFHTSIKRPSIAFPWEKLNNKPLVYASMGTLQNRRANVFEIIAKACADMDVQLVISLGGGLDPKLLPNLPENSLVVKYAPQLELLQKASLNITHAGLNTTLESLSYGVPMVAIPVTDDQPGVAARIAWTGVGEIVKLSRLSVEIMRETVERVLKEPSYKQNAVLLQEAIRHTKGVNHAVNIIEQAVSTKKPVISLLKSN